MKKLLLGGLMITASLDCMPQSLEKMQWFNEPAQWEIKGNSLSMNISFRSTCKADLVYRIAFYLLAK